MGLDERIFDLLEEAGSKILEVYNDPALINLTWKKDHSPLTNADLLSNEILVNGLQKLYPDWQIISEENFSAEVIQNTSGSFILIDPLDGTKEFVNRNGEFTINIGFLQDGKPAGGYISVPAQNKMYGAVLGRGAYRRESTGALIRLTSSTFSLSDDGLRFFVSRSHADTRSKDLIQKFKTPIVKEAGSALKYIYLAEGRAEIYIRWTPCMHWDTVAGQAILEESGGILLDCTTLQPLQYHNPDRVNPPLLALGRATDPERLRPLLY